MIRSRLKHALQKALVPSYRAKLQEQSRLVAMPRYQPTTTQFLGRTIQLVDGGTFVVGVQEIFNERVYQFHASSRTPLILDCGANIGLAVIYFKQLFPDCRIIAYEADPSICKALQANVRTFGLNGVDVRNEAVWTKRTTVRFHTEGGASGRVLTTGEGGHTRPLPVAEVPAVRLGEVVAEAGKVDFLKIDIEGAETAVLRDCESELKQVQSLFVEYHSVAGSPQTLDDLLSVLKRAGFRYYLREAHCPRMPYVEPPAAAGMDLQVNVFAIRA